MLQVLIKAAILTVIWRYLQPRLKWLIFSLAGILITLIAHSEYLSYVMLTNDYSGVPQSVWYKYCAIIIFVLVYFFGDIRERRKKRHELNRIPPLSKTSQSKNIDDGFDFLRQKDRLMTHGERLVEQINQSD